MTEIHYIILIVLLVLIVAIAITAMVVRHNDCKKLAYMLDAFEDGELNFRFTENSKYNRTLNRIRVLFERQRQRNEQESWAKLIRVLTHEIMNTITPIASLSDALSRIDIKKDNRYEDIKTGLETISSSSKDLIRFVESYRALAGVAKPQKKAIMLSDLIDKVLNLTSEQCAINNVKCSFVAKSDDILIYADEGQISQIFVNLIKNAIQASATQIKITACIDSSEQIIISFSNNGKPITKESQEQIFIPFFTTKKDGSGIGLSLSRQIMTSHNGSIDLSHSTPEDTEFLLKFK